MAGELPIATGLDEREAARRLAHFGPNELPVASRVGMLATIARVLREPMFSLLVAGAVATFMFGRLDEAVALLASVAVVVGITLYHERKTEHALDALREMSSPRALVIRSGKQRRIAGREVVPGDVMLLREGDRVPADASLAECQELIVDESLLTGESLPVRKRADSTEGEMVPVPGGEDLPYVYSGSLVVSGHAVARALATGAASQIGRIGTSLSGVAVEDSPLQVQTRHAVRGFTAAGLSLCLLVILLHGSLQRAWLDGVLAGITLAMAMLPEEFPVVLTVFLAMGAWRISRKKVLTRRIPAIETLGATTVLCVDKTGTLTENRMAVAELATDTEHHHAGDPNLAAAIAATIHVAALACPRDPVDPMEKAILAFAATDAPESMRMRKTWQLVREYSLTRELLAVTGCWQSPDDGSIIVASKGAPEAIADLCAFDAERRRRILAATAEMAARGRRVLGVAHCVWSELALPGNPRGFRFEFVGLIGLADPIRPGVAKAVRECAQAGIRVVMITGDYPGTARAIAAEIGLQSSGGVLTGAELASLGSTELRDRIADVNVFARVLPEQKLTLVDALKARGEVVAMTGDGVNDAPALKAAHIGIAMGGRGTDVAREAASLVLLEDDFDSIVEAVRLGRRIYDNIRHALAYLIAVHVPIAGMATLPLLLGWPPVFSPVHIVFLEFIIDPACSFAFEAEPENPGTMKRPPRPPNEPLLGMSLLAQSFMQGAIMLGATAVLYAYALHSFADVEHARAIAFAALVMGNMMLILGNRSQTRGILETLRMPNPALWWTLGGACLGLAAAVYVPWFRQLFGFSLLGPMDILACFATAALGALCGEVIRLRRSESRTRR